MTRIKNKKQYEITAKRVNELLAMVSNEEPIEETLLTELDLLGNLMADYEGEHFPITPPSLSEVLKYRMVEMKLTQGALADLLGVSQSRVSEYLTGKSEPTLTVARNIHKKLGIDADIILGVC